MVSKTEKRKSLKSFLGKGGMKFPDEPVTGYSGPTKEQRARIVAKMGNKASDMADGKTAMDALKRANPVLAGVRAAASGVRSIQSGGRWLDQKVVSPLARALKNVLKKK